MSDHSLAVDGLMQHQFDQAKRWLGIVTCCRLSVVVITAITSFIAVFAAEAATLSAIIAIGATLAQWQSDHNKRLALTLLRKIEFRDGLGWPITPRELSDVFVDVPPAVQKRLLMLPSHHYFASSTAPSARRILENLEESAWWTKHQARRMAHYVAWLSAAIVGIGALTLVVTIQQSANQTMVVTIAKIVLAVIAVMFSGGYISRALEYHRFAQQATQAEDRACALLAVPVAAEIDAIKLVHDYQIARSGAPLLPRWLWRHMQPNLNMLWKQRSQKMGVRGL